MSESSVEQPMNSFRVLRALKTVVPDALVITGRTNLPVLTLPQRELHGIRLGPVKIFYNLAPKQFRIVDDSNPKYEYRCGTAFEVLEELESILDVDLPEPPLEIQHLK